MLASRVFRVVYKDVVLFPQKKKKKQITIYSLMVWRKFKLHNCGLKFDTLPTGGLIKIKLPTSGLKSHEANVPLDSFLLSCTFMFSVCFLKRDT